MTYGHVSRRTHEFGTFSNIFSLWHLLKMIHEISPLFVIHTNPQARKQKKKKKSRTKRGKEEEES